MSFGFQQNDIPRIAVDNNVIVVLAGLDKRFKEIMHINPDEYIYLGLTYNEFKKKYLKNSKVRIEDLTFSDFFGKNARNTRQLSALVEIFKLVKLKKIELYAPETVIREIYCKGMVYYFKHKRPLNSFIRENCYRTCYYTGESAEAYLTDMLLRRLVQSDENKDYAFPRNSNPKHAESDAKIYVESALCKCHILTMDEHFSNVEKIRDITKTFCEDVEAKNYPEWTQFVKGAYKYRPYTPESFLKAYIKNKGHEF